MLWKPPGARCPPLAGHPAARLSSATQSAAASRGSAPLASSSPFFFLQQSPRPFECVQLGMWQHSGCCVSTGKNRNKLRRKKKKKRKTAQLSLCFPSVFLLLLLSFADSDKESRYTYLSILPISHESRSPPPFIPDVMSTLFGWCGVGKEEGMGWTLGSNGILVGSFGVLSLFQ